MQKVYFISGLGADERAFQFLDLSYCDPVFVQWVKPLKNEQVSSYAARLYEQINDPGAIIVGLSFGGMMAMQIASQFPIQQVILISSCRDSRQLPFYLKSLRYLPLHKLLRADWLKWGNQAAYKLMGIARRKDKVLFTQMLSQADNDFISWALHTIIHWNYKAEITNTIQIHGKADFILPCRYIDADYLVDKGDHLMLMSMPAQISPLLQKVITEAWDR